jgi:hypothetical protein
MAFWYFYSNLVYYVAIWYMYILQFWHVAPSKTCQPWRGGEDPHPLIKQSRSILQQMPALYKIQACKFLST